MCHCYHVCTNSVCEQLRPCAFGLYCECVSVKRTCIGHGTLLLHILRKYELGCGCGYHCYDSDEERVNVCWTVYTASLGCGIRAEGARALAATLLTNTSLATLHASGKRFTELTPVLGTVNALI